MKQLVIYIHGKGGNALESELTVVKNAEHWFHTDRQIKAPDEWFKCSFA